MQKRFGQTTVAGFNVPKNTLSSFRGSEKSRQVDLNRTQYNSITEEEFDKRYSIGTSSKDRSRKSNVLSGERPIVAYEVSVGSGTTMREVMHSKPLQNLGPT